MIDAVAEAPLIRLESASRVFRMGELEVPALAGADLVVESGEFIIVLGPSGSGKTTLLNLIGGLDRPTSGRIWHGRREIGAFSDDELTRYRREEVGFIFQFYNLVPTLTAFENVQVATELVAQPLPPADALALVGLSDRAGHFPAQLSGGEQQRVAIARALAKRPTLLLADEPTGALDLPTARNVLELLQRLNREQRLTTILITHNSAIAGVGTRMIRIASGRIEESRKNEHVVPAQEIKW